MSRTPPARPATSTLRADSSGRGPEGFVFERNSISHMKVWIKVQ